MMNSVERVIDGVNSGSPVQPASQPFANPFPAPPSGVGLSQAPVIEVFESDGTFNVYADFRPVLEAPGMDIQVQFAQQGMILTGGTVQRYLPVPTDAHIEHARVTIADGIVRVSIRTADSGHRWRSIVMW